MSFYLSAKVARVGLPSVYLNIFTLVATRLIKFKFNIEHPLDKTMNGLIHMTKIATVPI